MKEVSLSLSGKPPNLPKGQVTWFDMCLINRLATCRAEAACTFRIIFHCCSCCHQHECLLGQRTTAFLGYAPGFCHCGSCFFPEQVIQAQGIQVPCLDAGSHLLRTKLHKRRCNLAGQRPRLAEKRYDSCVFLRKPSSGLSDPDKQACLGIQGKGPACC